jgi:hypothetical protein
VAPIGPCRPLPPEPLPARSLIDPQRPLPAVAGRSPAPRLAALLGRGEGWLLHPGRSALLALLLGALLLPVVRERWPMAALALLAFWLLLQTLRLEAPLLEKVPFPPLTVLVLGMVVRWGLGPLVMFV